MSVARRSVCPHDCPSACGVSVSVEDGRIVDVVGDSAHPFTQGVICGKVHDYAERVYSPLRVLHPMRRVGPKGAGEFERISWEEALEEIAHRFTRVMAQWGPEAILPFSYAGPLGRIQYYAGHPFFHALGASQLDRTILRCHVPPNRFFLNSSFSQSALLRTRQAGAAVFLHPEDAAVRGIVPGELVAVWNDRGRALFTAVLTDDTPPGQVVIEGIWWHKFMPGGRGVNVLTSDKVADLGGGPAFHSTMVEVERAPSSAETSWRHLAGTAAP